VDATADSYRENATFYYLTGSENTPGAILAIDGKTRESWLFVHAWHRGVPLEAEPGDASAQKLGLQHVVDWAELDSFLTRLVQASAKIYCESGTAELPPNLVEARDNHTPTWIQALTKKWPTLDIQFVEGQISGLMNVESAGEQELSRAVARATVPAVMAGIRGIRPGISQRKIELAVESACWNAGAHGVSFWPWVMGGANGVFPRPLTRSRVMTISMPCCSAVIL
jgi:Xaa-Pro aminopeptidase